MVHTDAALQHGKRAADLRQAAVVWREDIHGPPKDALDKRSLVPAVQLYALEVPRELLALALAQGKNYDLHQQIFPVES